MFRWINIQKVRPNEKVRVLIKFEYYRNLRKPVSAEVGIAYYDDGEWYPDNMDVADRKEFNENNAVTHWAPLPL